MKLLDAAACAQIAGARNVTLVYVDVPADNISDAAYNYFKTHYLPMECSNPTDRMNSAMNLVNAGFAGDYAILVGNLKAEDLYVGMVNRANQVWWG